MRAKDNKKLKVKSEKLKRKKKVSLNSSLSTLNSTLKVTTIYGNVDGRRVPSRILEEQIQHAVRGGARELHIIADGQHGIGGRIWPRDEKVLITIDGPVGQRLGSMGMSNTEIIVNGSLSDDVGWLNCGAKITIMGDVTNGAHNAAAQGILYVRGSGGARCDTMTKHNPRYDPPQSWYLRDVGDTFAEFKAGGIAVVCGVNPRNPRNILGYRPCVGMVGGVIYFRGDIEGSNYCKEDVELLSLTEEDWRWLCENMKPFLSAIDMPHLYDELTASIDDWKKLIPYTYIERAKRIPFKMAIEDFRKEIWEKEVGEGGIFAEYLAHPLTVLPYITTGEDRRYNPLWNNEKYSSPCEYACPTGIPTAKRAGLIREGKMHEAIELILQYSPLPATVCGEICPNLCMQSCTRGKLDNSIDTRLLGKASLEAKPPRKAPSTGKKIAIIGGGPGGLSVAWHLSLKGHDVQLYETEEKLGGKLELCIPRERLPQEVLKKEIERFKEIGVNIHLSRRVDKKEFERIYGSHDIVVIATGAHKPKKLNILGSEYMITAYDFLRGINLGEEFDLKDKRVIIIGAGNVGMDVAAQAFRCGAVEVTAIDVQRPQAFGKELEIAQSLGTKIIWPKFTERYDHKQKRLYFKDGASMPADMVFVSIGDTPEISFLTPTIDTEDGWIKADEVGYTSDSKVFAIGDATRLGLVTNAIGQGRLTAEAIHAQLKGQVYKYKKKEMIPYEKIKTVYYEAEVRVQSPNSKLQTPNSELCKSEAERCMSCGICRDCHMCETICYWDAIARIERNGSYEYVVDDKKCIGCGFCAGICPCGVWEMVENV